jgi:GNAT superfamily N-acetyltransferase
VLVTKVPFKPPFDVREAAQLDQAAIDTVESGLREFNTAHAGPSDFRPLWLYARDVDGAVQAGLHAETARGWCFVHILWVAPQHRKSGLGSQLLTLAETTARARGCIGIYLDTFSFQAPAFYARHGFVELGRLLDLPAGGAKIWLMKRF